MVSRPRVLHRRGNRCGGAIPHSHQVFHAPTSLAGYEWIVSVYMKPMNKINEAWSATVEEGKNMLVWDE
jgi:hypothetical protein